MPWGEVGLKSQKKVHDKAKLEIPGGLEGSNPK